MTATLGRAGDRRARHDRDDRSVGGRGALEAGARSPLIRGLFSGGTLCYESLVILGRTVGEVHSNTPINKAWGLPAPAGSHQCLDLGEEEYTRGRPHPMIDPEARLELLREHAADPQVAVIILDVVLGHGADADPAKTLAPACESAMNDGGPQVVAYVLGTDQDPQGYQAQRDRLVQAGCIVTETAARASLSRRRSLPVTRTLVRREEVRTVSAVSAVTDERAGGPGHLLDEATGRCRAHAVTRRRDVGRRHEGRCTLGDPAGASSGPYARRTRGPGAPRARLPRGADLRVHRRPRGGAVEAGRRGRHRAHPDRISASAAVRVRDAGAHVECCAPSTTSTTSPRAALINCQLQAIDEPDQLVVVSEVWHAG